MKVVILAGGLGTRLSEATGLLPKPLVEVGNRPILWHVMKMYSAYGFNEFIICAGYKAHLIKSYFANYFTENYDITVDLARNSIEFHGDPNEQWKVSIIDTGFETMTGGRIKRIAPYVENSTFCVTYGDGVGDVPLDKVVEFHHNSGKIATVTAVPSPGRFGILEIGDDDVVERFHEKPDNEVGWINGGFFVMEPSIFDYIDGDHVSLERTPLERLASDKQLAAFRHNGFWRPMDTLRDQRELEEFWKRDGAPWKMW